MIFKEAEEQAEINAKENDVKEPTKTIKEIFEKVSVQKPLVKYAILFAVLLIIVTSLFLLKPNITGSAIIHEEVAYYDNVNLIANESSDYVWKLNNILPLKSKTPYCLTPLIVSISGRVFRIITREIRIRNLNMCFQLGRQLIRSRFKAA